MTMLLNILCIIAGGAMVLIGADRLTDGSVALARRLKISEMTIGLTIVAFGTSMPEFVISLVSGLKDSAGLAVGNIVGSNIFNTLMIAGTAAIVCPISISHVTVKKDIPFVVIASAVLIIMCTDNLTFDISGSRISHTDGIILLVMFALFMYVTLRSGKNTTPQVNENAKKTLSLPRTVVYILLGLLLLIGGSEIFVFGAKGMALSLNVSESVVGLTIVACGTSLPELATSIVAAKKGRSALAIGNVIGSNVFNILWILGATAVVSPLNVSGITIIDLLMMLISMIILWLFCFTKYKVNRWEGIVLVTIYIFYMSHLITTAQ